MVGFPNFLKSRRGAWAIVAVGAVGAAAAGLGAWFAFWPAAWPSAPIASTIVVPGPAQPATPNSGEAVAPADPVSRAGAKLAFAPATGTPSAAPSKGSAANEDATTKANPAPTAASPQFDVVRVEPSGESVIAGRGAPGATIALLDGDTELARGVADSNGEVVFLPPPLAPGEHALTLRSGPADARTPASSPSVKVVVPKAKDHGVVVARAAPEQPAASRSANRAPNPNPGGAPSASVAAKPAPAVAIRSAEAEEGGSFLATGSAPAGSQSRLYLNGSFVGKVIADLNGLWSLKVEKGMQPGHYVVRADEVEPESGKVLARAEVPFDFPAPPPPVAQAGPLDRLGKASPQAPSKDRPQAQVAASSGGVAAAVPDSAAAVVKEVRTATVVRGDSLWRISRKMLGRGNRYTQIYEANASQIRNPKLVFPGQVFVLPSDPG
jgi:nucleoid-associated protein YgaU